MKLKFIFEDVTQLAWAKKLFVLELLGYYCRVISMNQVAVEGIRGCGNPSIKHFQRVGIQVQRVRSYNNNRLVLSEKKNCTCSFSDLKLQ